MTRSFCLFACLGLVLGGCGLFGGGASSSAMETPELPPGPVAVTLVGQADMNGGGNAARLYLYPLGSDAAFLATPLRAFWDDPEGALGDDLTGSVRDATVRPGSATDLEEVTLAGAPFLGIAADLRQPDGDRWRAVLPASQVRGKALRITVSEGGIAVVAE